MHGWTIWYGFAGRHGNKTACTTSRHPSKILIVLIFCCCHIRNLNVKILTDHVFSSVVHVLFQHNATAGWVSSRTSYECADKLVHSCPMSKSNTLNRPTCPQDMLPV